MNPAASFAPKISIVYIEEINRHMRTGKGGIQHGILFKWMQG